MYCTSVEVVTVFTVRGTSTPVFRTSVFRFEWDQEVFLPISLFTSKPYLLGTVKRYFILVLRTLKIVLDLTASDSVSTHP